MKLVAPVALVVVTAALGRGDGVTCVNQTGHRFFINVQSYQVF